MSFLKISLLFLITYFILYIPMFVLKYSLKLNKYQTGI